MTTSGVAGAGDACFGQAARRLLGVMARLCGWRPDEFWRATPEDAAMVLAGLMDEADGGRATGGGCDAAILATMMERFPDG